MLKIRFNNGFKIVYLTGYANNTFIFPISFTGAYGLAGLTTANRDNDNSNVLGFFDATLTQAFIRGTFASGPNKGYQNNYSRLVIVGF